MFIAFKGKGGKALRKIIAFILPLTAFLFLYASLAVKNNWHGAEAEQAGPGNRHFRQEAGVSLWTSKAPGPAVSTTEPAVSANSPLKSIPGIAASSRESVPAPILPLLLPLYRQNNDFAGWLHIEGTGIDYPVMYTPGDEDYYIDKNFSRKPDKNGTLFIQADCDPFKPGVNIIIHGHNMKKSGKMFAPLIKYKDEAYFRKHPKIRYDTLTEEIEYDIMAVFLSQVYLKSDNVFKYYKFVKADIKAEFDSFTSAVKELSLYETGVDAEFGDTFITLSTCEYSRKNGRMVIVARKTHNK